MKKSTRIRLIAMAVALMMLCGAITYAAINGSPYETLKRAVLNALTYGNKTIEGYALATFGDRREEQWSYGINGDDSSLEYHFDEDGNIISYTYTTAGLRISSVYVADDGIQWYQAFVHRAYDDFRAGIFSVINPDDRYSATMRFAELLADTLVGDLKNNITMSSSGSVRHISGMVTDSQMPELFRAGVDVLIEQANSSATHSEQHTVSFDEGTGEHQYEYIYIEKDKKTVTLWKQYLLPSDDAGSSRGWGIEYIDGKAYRISGAPVLVSRQIYPATREDYPDADNDLLNLPIKSFTLDFFRGEADVDEYGNLLYMEINASITVENIFHETHSIEIQTILRGSDFGTSVAACPIPGAEQALDFEKMKDRFGQDYISVYFKLNADGSIDEDSMTDIYPYSRGSLNPYDPWSEEVLEEDEDEAEDESASEEGQEFDEEQEAELEDEALDDTEGEGDPQTDDEPGDGESEEA
ncbi:MAG: hypothetical protein LBH09_03425 [Peptococcaceae bacterium]|jgi:hypothetical protein|nr:hypothetical protein [Peptococcaceae bacterium]